MRILRSIIYAAWHGRYIVVGTVDRVMINSYYGPVYTRIVVQILDVVTIVTYTKEDWYAVRPTNQL